jgi:hypothetical protein
LAKTPPAKMNAKVNIKDLQLSAEQMQRQKQSSELMQESIEDMFDMMDGDGIEEEIDANVI